MLEISHPSAGKHSVRCRGRVAPCGRSFRQNPAAAVRSSPLRNRRSLRSLRSFPALALFFFGSLRCWQPVHPPDVSCILHISCCAFFRHRTDLPHFCVSFGPRPVQHASNKLEGFVFLYSFNGFPALRVTAEAHDRPPDALASKGGHAICPSIACNTPAFSKLRMFLAETVSAFCPSLESLALDQTFADQLSSSQGSAPLLHNRGRNRLRQVSTARQQHALEPLGYPN